MGTAKAASILEEAPLNYAREQFLTAAGVDELVEMANRRAQREAARPPIDVGPLEDEGVNLNRRRGRLIELVAGDEAADMEAVRRQIAEIGKRIRSLEEEVRAARR